MPGSRVRVPPLLFPKARESNGLRASSLLGVASQVPHRGTQFALFFVLRGGDFLPPIAFVRPWGEAPVHGVGDDARSGHAPASARGSGHASPAYRQCDEPGVLPRRSIARHKSPNDLWSHAVNVCRSNSSTSSARIVATRFTHSATVSGGAGPTPVSCGSSLTPRAVAADVGSPRGGPGVNRVPNACG